jgi:cytochrome c-type biogenesis protein CcmE
MRKYGKFAALIAVVIGTLVWLAFAGTGDSKTYYKSMGERAYGARLRVGGDVAAGSIQHVDRKVLFTLQQDSRTLQVAYAGIDPLPDTFRDGAQALVDGRMDRDGTFHASKISAKCASKYEAKPNVQAPGQPDVHGGKPSV